MTTIDRDTLAGIHRFWFGELKSPSEPPPQEIMDRWFSAKPEFDAEVRDNYERYLEPAKAKDWDLGALSRIEQVGLIVLLDQFPRNIYRQTHHAYDYDQKALATAKALLANGVGVFFPVERNFVTLPFMHAENIVEQDRSMLYMAEALNGIPSEMRTQIRIGMEYAYKHWDIVRKFGRFPHRNVMMGRESTPEEIEFLKGGRGF
ncbi:MAG TPA: DUF924 family protein [Bauldia sp.]|nr:DUF924 family protein [Bauldia sp.]